MDSTRTVGFRQDINGMRAIAVIGVIAFHFKLGPLRAGGFAGVDVFFVISGFLMTQIITGRLDRGRFSLLEFLSARVRRIVPAFVALVIVVLLAGLVLLNPLQYESLTQRGAWTLVFASNVLFARQGAYFVTPDQNWLLHTWSLSVEAQFYLVFPLLLLHLSRRLGGRRSFEISVLSGIGAFSFAIMIWSLSAGGDSRSWSFYMLWSRAWEFLAGGLCAYAMLYERLGRTLRLSLHYGGMAGVFLSMLVFHNTTPWPSIATLLPVVGTAAMLLAGHGEPGWARFAPMRALGLWSYSVYLWHWPIAAISSFFGHSSLPFRLAGIVLSVLLGFASFVLIERRATNYLWGKPRRWRIGFATFALALVFSAVASGTNGLEAVRFAFQPSVLAKLRDFRTARYDWLDEGEFCDSAVGVTSYVDECRFGSPRSNDVLVIGDSFAAQLTPRYVHAFPAAKFGIAFATRGACVPLSQTTYTEYDATCDKWTEQLYPFALKSDFKRVVFVAFWPMYTQGRLCLLTEPNCGTDLDPKRYDKALDAAYRRLAELWKRLRQQGKEVVVYDVVPYPGLWGDPLKLYDRVAGGEPMDRLDIGYDDFMKKHEAATHRLETAAAYAGVTLVNPALPLCPEGRCPIVKDGRPLYKDAFHLRASMMKEPRFSIFDRYIVPSRAMPLPIN